jgi:hypothetical protein
MADASVVDHNVQGALTLKDGIDGTLHRLVIGHVLLEHV